MSNLKSDFQVSVVIPVYNAGRFVQRAVNQVLQSPEVAEIVLWEDGSPDDSLAICEKLAAQHDIVKLYRHEGGVNKGAANTRNAAIKASTCEFIAFADADNIWLPDRFRLDREIFASDPSAEGIYHAMGIHYEDEESRKQFEACGLTGGEFLSVSGPVPPEEFLAIMLSTHPTEKLIGGLGVDAITLRRSCFEKTGYFNTQLKLQQDAHFYVKMAATCRMVAGDLVNPVALRGVHGEMRSTDTAKQIKYGRMRWELLRKWFKAEVKSRPHREMFEKAYADSKIRDTDGWSKFWTFLRTSLAFPSEIFQEYGRFDLNCQEVFGQRRIPIRLMSAKNRILRTLGIARPQQ